MAELLDDKKSPIQSTKNYYANDALGVSEVGYGLVKGEDPTMAIAGLVSGKIASVGQSKLSTTNTDVDFSRQQTGTETLKQIKLSEGGASLSQKISDVDLTTKGKVTADTTRAVAGVKVADVDVPKAKGPVETRTQADEIAVAQPKQTEKSYDREQILKNIEASRQAREASNFDQYLAKEKSLIENWNVDEKRYEKWNQYVKSGIEPQDRVKLQDWRFPPEPEFFLENKKIYDNTDYFNQLTGDTIYPGTPESASGRIDGSVHKDGFLNGEYKESTLMPGTKINRIGSNPTGRYFSPEGATFGEKALPPFMKLQPNSDYIVLKEITTKEGLIAPWFNEPGMGIQYYTDLTIDELEKGNYVLKIK